MPQNCIKFSIILSLIMISTACGYQQKVYPNCIKNTQLSSLSDGQFVLHEPLGWQHSVAAFMNPKWSDASICIEAALSPTFNCSDTFKERYAITSLKAGDHLTLDGTVKLSEPWGLATIFTNKRSIYLRGYIDNTYFWLSTDHLRLLTNNPKALDLYKHNQAALDYLHLNQKLEILSIPKYWPCDPLISPEDKW